MLPMDFAAIDFIFNNGQAAFNEIEDAAGARMLYSISDIDIVKMQVEYMIKEVMHCQKLIWQISFSFHKFNNFFLLCLISYNVRLPVICVACVYITGNNFTGLIR